MALQSYNWHLFIQLISWGFYYRITNVFIQDTKTCQGFVIRKLQGSLYILEKVPRSCPRVKAKPRTNSWKLRFPVDGLIGPRCKITHETNSPTQQQLPYARNDFLWFSDEKKAQRNLNGLCVAFLRWMLSYLEGRQFGYLFQDVAEPLQRTGQESHFASRGRMTFQLFSTSKHNAMNTWVA